MRKNYRENSSFFKPNGNRRPGYFTDWADKYYDKTNPAEKDNKIRTSIIEAIEINYKNGESIDEIVKKLANDELIQEHFLYLTKRGIKLEESFKNWFLSKQKNEEKESTFKNGSSTIKRETEEATR